MTNDETIETLTKITMKTGNLKIKLIQNINENYNSISMMINKTLVHTLLSKKVCGS